MTGQPAFASDALARDLGLRIAVDLANAVAIADAPDRADALRDVFAQDPPSLALLQPQDVMPLTELARTMELICALLIQKDVDAAARRLNDMLSEYSAQPHLALENGRWRLHHHPPNVELIPMWTAIAADAFARLIDAGHIDRLGRCAAPDCTRLFFDATKNGSRRFCSTTCQNRVKAAAYRRRQRQSC